MIGWPRPWPVRRQKAQVRGAGAGETSPWVPPGPPGGDWRQHDGAPAQNPPAWLPASQPAGEEACTQGGPGEVATALHPGWPASKPAIVARRVGGQPARVCGALAPLKRTNSTRGPPPHRQDLDRAIIAAERQRALAEGALGALYALRVTQG